MSYRILPLDEFTMDVWGKRFKVTDELPTAETALFKWVGTWLHVTDENGKKWLECIGGMWQCKKCGFVNKVPFGHKHN